MKKVALFTIFLMGLAGCAMAYPQAVPVTAIADATPGASLDQKPEFPQFYFWRKVYEKNRPSHFRLFLSNGHGSIIQVAGNKDRFQEITGNNDLSKLNMELNSGSVRKIMLPKNPSKMEFQYEEWILSAKITQTAVVPHQGNANWFGILGRNPTMYDYLYLWTSNSADTGGNNWFYEFYPGGIVFYFIGKNVVGKPHFNVDGHWMVWASGDPSSGSDRQLHLYSTAGNIDYLLTNGHSDNRFYKWAQEYSGSLDEQVNDLIASGKGYFLKKQYKNAINEYQKAVRLYPRNDVAYGLMGYCYLRQGNTEDAVVSLRKSIDLNPGNYLSRYNFVLALWAGGKKLEAMEELKHLLRLNPSYQKILKKDSQFHEIILSKEYGGNFGR